MPLLARARELAERGAIPGGTRRNLESLSCAVEFAAGIDETTRLLLADAQTSGGLLIALPETQVPALRAALERERAPAAAAIGRVVAGPPVELNLSTLLYPRPSTLCPRLARAAGFEPATFSSGG